jgi:PD-(D/E)XK nuclease superfamily
VAGDDATLPKVTPFLVQTADSMCARRLACEFRGEPGTADPVNRARVRHALLDTIRTWHETGTWSEPVDLFPEEAALVTHATRWYTRCFPETVAEVTLPVESPTELARRGVQLGGWVDLGVVHPDGRRELRQLAWRGRGAPADPLDVPAVRLAVLRLACEGWLAESLEVTCADLLVGSVSRAGVTRADLDPLGAWLDERLGILRRRADPDVTAPGRDCSSCRYVPGCPAHAVRGSMATRRDSLVPAVVSVTPTSLDVWQRCVREWRNRILLALPPSDDQDGAAHGLWLHRLLNLVHRTGSCHDGPHVEETLAANGADARTAEEVRRHAIRCPIGAEPLGHEVEWARARADPPVFVATARLDAVWVHDGILDVRDYKTGRVADRPLSQDSRARLQAWVAAPQAAARGLTLQLRYEHLAAEVVEDPEPWAPTDEELASIDEELAATVAAMHAERDYAGVRDSAVCDRCRYRSICTDSAAPGTPSWPNASATEAADLAAVDAS